MSKITVSIFIPVYNEGKIIESTIKQSISALEKLGMTFELVIADDGSTDSTPAIVSNMTKKEKRLNLFRESINRGRGEILNLAFQKAQGKIIAFYDADLSTDLKYLPQLINSIKNSGYDIATGSRWFGGWFRSSYVKRGIMRLFVSFVYNNLIRILFRSNLKDHQCGFKSFKKSVILDIVKDAGMNRSRRWAWDTEILLRARRKGYKIYEFPVMWEEKRKSKVKPIREFSIIFGYVFKLFFKFLLER